MKLDGYGEELGGGSRIEIHTDFGGETWREEASCRAYRVILKSPYMGKMICLFMNTVLCMGAIVLIAHTDTSVPLTASSL